MVKEIWKPIKGFSVFYEISNFGRVRSCKGKGPSYKTKTPVILKPKKAGKNHYKPGGAYYCVALRKKGKSYYHYIHRLVASAFLHKPRKLRKPEVNHINGIKSDNTVFNLEWVNRRSNVFHQRHILDRTTKGVNHFNAKINDEIALSVKLMLRDNVHYKVICSKLGISTSIVMGIKTGVTWKHVKI